VISVQSVEKRYGKTIAVSDLSFTVNRGEIVGLLGHNGAGKTTIMKVMTGYLEPTQGSVKIDGLDVIDDRLKVQKKIGYLPENSPLYPEMQVQEYLNFMADLRGIKGKSRTIAINEALQATGLEARRYQVIQTLSKGYKQRVGLAQAILHKPSILILDEPTNGLDPVQILEIRALIKRLAEHSTIIISTHILSEIEAVCDRVVILIDGQLAADQSLSHLLNRSNILLTVGQAKDVAGTLRHVNGVQAIDEIKDHQAPDHYKTYRIKVKPNLHSTPAITKAAVEAGWQVDRLAQENVSLEGVFRDLMHQHIAKSQVSTQSLTSMQELEGQSTENKKKEIDQEQNQAQESLTQVNDLSHIKTSHSSTQGKSKNKKNKSKKSKRKS
jgi:ABC-2 type transport system ATP-binding protein